MMKVLPFLIQSSMALNPNLLCKVGQSDLYAYNHNSVTSQSDALATSCSFLDKKIKEYEQAATITTSSEPVVEDNCFIENLEQFDSVYELYQGLNSLYENSFCSQDNDGWRDSDTISPFERLNGYGCYCKMDDPSFRGVGVPINVFDQQCLAAQEAALCTIFDSASNSRKRSAFVCNQDFTGYFIRADGGTGLIESCELFNGFLATANGWNQEETDCAINKCKVDSSLITFMLASAVGQTEPFQDTGIWIERGGTFDRAAVCGERLHPDRAPRNEECCGLYPDRRPMGRKFECCRGNDNEMIFNRRTERCCKVGDQFTVTGSGECQGEVV